MKRTTAIDAVAVSKTRKADLVFALTPYLGTECHDWSRDELESNYMRIFAPDCTGEECGPLCIVHGDARDTSSVG